MIFSGCNIIDVHERLQDIESYIVEHPDSALAAIESIDNEMIKTKSLKAHHALLHAMSLDKNYIDVTDDSLALEAVRYYRKHGPKKNLARSTYYLALSYFNDGQYDKSIIELAKAEDVAKRYDSLYLGFIKVLQADIHNINYNDIQELECLEEALGIYTAIGADFYINVSKLSLAKSYVDNHEYEKADSLFLNLIMSKEVPSKLRYQAMKSYAYMLATQPDSDYDSAAGYFEKAAAETDGRYFTTQDYWVWAYSLMRIGREKECDTMVSSLKQLDTSGTAYYWMYRIAKRKGDYEKSLLYLEKNNIKENHHIAHILKQSISTIQRDYYQLQYEAADYQADKRLLSIVLISTTAVLSAILICFYTIRYRRKKEEEKNEYIRYAEEIVRQLRDLQKDSYNSLQKKYISMYKNKYETLRSLYEHYLVSYGRVDADKIIYRKVVHLIDELRNDIQDNKAIEKLLNEDLNEIISSLRAEFPGLSKRDHTLIGYLALGFDAPVISHFMNCSTNSIYIRKSRLKKVFEESDAEHKSVFLELIG